MPRDIPVGNGSFLITFDRDYCLRDIYYPFAGMENHSDGYKFRFGIWVDRAFRWINKEWELRLEYQDESLLTRVTALNETAQVHLDSQDLVDYRENIFLRRIIIRNLAETEREARLFFHHDFRILETARGDTAYYDPDEKAIIHYKENRYFLMSSIRENAHGIDQFATGRKEFQGLEGTWRDAEDGRLEGNPISQGSVDSTLGISVALPPHNDKTVYYWICAGNSFEEVDRLNRIILGHGPEYITRRTTNYWKAWLNKSELILPDLPPKILDLFKKSLLILRTNINSNGAIIAGNDSDVYGFARDTYGYMWPRDGALTAYALDLAGYFDITSRFFEFCCRIIGRGKEIVGYFLHKYNPDGSLGSSWHPWIVDGKKQVPIQEDSTGLVLWAFWFHFNKFRDVEFTVAQYENLVIRCGDFLASYRDEKTGLPLPSYDLWEERWGIHTFTVAAVYAGLKAAENFAVFFNDRRRRLIYGRASEEIKAAADQYLFDQKTGRFLKSLVPGKDGSLYPDDTIDASIFAPFYFGLFEPHDYRITATMQQIKDRLWIKTAIGGLGRYEGDGYHSVTRDIEKVPGNPWFICTLWLAQWYIAKAKTLDELRTAVPILEWVAAGAMPSGVLAEQVHPFTGEPLSVAPLTWSHATFVAAVLEYANKFKEISQQG